MVKKSQSGVSKPPAQAAEPADVAAARAAARNTDSAPAQPAPPQAAQGDLPAQKAAEAQALAAAQPHNANKLAEYEGNGIELPPAGTAVPPPSPRATASTLSEQNANAKAGTVAAPGAQPLVGPLDRVRVDATGQRLTTNLGVPIADNQHSLKAGARGPALLEDFILREKITHFDHERIPERIVHARGSGAHGFFENYAPLTDLTRAAPFQEAGKITPVFVRFSTVAGERGSKDTARDVRGFAVKFYTDEGNWDLVGNNMPVFFIQDAMKFPDLVHAVKPEPHHAMPQAASAHDTFWDFVGLMPESTHMLMWQMSDRAIPRSYRTMQGFGVHTFRLVNAQGESRFVKFHWQPKLGTHSLVWDEAVKISGADPDYHRRDLWEAIEAGEYPEWELGLQVFTEEEAERFSFDILDATKIVPEELVPIQLVGRLVLNRNPDNFFAETEQVAFCTAHIIPGIDFTNDPLLAGRIHSYVDTQISRLGGPNFHEIPINAPIAPVHNNQRDGMHRQAIHRGRVAYEPNSLGGGCPFQAGAAQGFMSVQSRQEAQEAHHKVRIKPEKFADHYTQARLFYESQSPVEQAHIAAAFRFELSKVTVPAVRERVVAGLRNASEALAAQVAAGLGMELPAPLPLAIATPAEPEVRQSPALSLLARPGEGGIRTRKVALVVADGVAGAPVQQLVQALFAEGAVPRVVAPRLGAVRTADGLTLQADASLENAPGFLFDALVLPDGPEGVALLSRVGQVMEFVKDQYRHCKPLLVLGASQGLLAQAEVPLTLPDGRHDPGLILGDAQELPALTPAFIAAIARHRHFERDQDPPLV
ncbi:catalase [Xenophilus sp. Marseille-Q4582]|uniref:catalase n=1 Tax=Xenophilus sp. Marseille-Q4582 TaxID=2866600 RepID=UPI001CE45A8E|nr:catalase [Xenophilus sp. Marseille-Q4582]